MTAETLKKLKIRLNIGDENEDELLEVLWGEATDEILLYAGDSVGERDDFLEKVAPIIQKYTVIKYNLVGNEGEAARKEGDIHRTFDTAGNGGGSNGSGLPSSIKGLLDSTLCGWWW